ncbi:hypothetical protein [Sphingosinicella sp. CPCC 101087]|uniref:hypothetical protein n=1 Tax=Sphingosinicella sp. CPCC 101087 TaxID=2497754 RepID=UPI00101DACC1|nr:hypothetical protein [Sphingosinicella sp. CPCC 101087]
MKAFSLAATLILAWSAAAVAQPVGEVSPVEQSLRQCGATFDDFFWTHDIEGTTFIHMRDGTEERLGAERLHCVERWAMANSRHLFLWPDGRSASREVVDAKARACSLDPERDLEWTFQTDRGVRATLLDRGATYSQFRCLLDWADHTGAPVGFAASPSDSD